MKVIENLPFLPTVFNMLLFLRSSGLLFGDPWSAIQSASSPLRMSL